MNEKNVNECLYCGCYDEDFGCTMPSIDKWYACPLERNEEELREMFNKSDELIRKSEVIKAIKRVLGGYCMGSAVAGAINEIQPVNAVELPCKIGDEVFEPIMKSGTIYSRTVKGFTVSDQIELINCETKNFYWFEIGKKVFFTREEAEKVLEELRNE